MSSAKRGVLGVPLFAALLMLAAYAHVQLLRETIRIPLENSHACFGSEHHTCSCDLPKPENNECIQLPCMKLEVWRGEGASNGELDPPGAHQIPDPGMKLRTAYQHQMCMAEVMS
jgi:hypothetical protein